MCQVILKEDCCIWIEDNKDVVAGHIKKIRELQQQAREIGHEGLQIGNIFSSVG